METTATKDIEAKVDSLVNEFGADYSTRLVGETVRDLWKCDAWRVSFQSRKTGKRFETDFFTGLGLRRGIPPITPSAASVLSSLLLESDTSDMSFNDWCDEFGYSNDSIKALNTYQLCCETGKKLLQIFSRGQLAELREALQDY